jgi:hypothetical protein
VLWIRIGFNEDPDTEPDPAFLSMRIRIQIQGFDDQNLKHVHLRKIFIFFLSKIAIYLSLGLHKGRPSYRRSLHPLERENLALQDLNFLHTLWVFMALLDQDPADQYECRSGSTTLPESKIKIK